MALNYVVTSSTVVEGTTFLYLSEDGSEIKIHMEDEEDRSSMADKLREIADVLDDLDLATLPPEGT